jgi:hypothetical protein
MSPQGIQHALQADLKRAVLFEIITLLVQYRPAIQCIDDEGLVAESLLMAS